MTEGSHHHEHHHEAALSSSLADEAAVADEQQQLQPRPQEVDVVDGNDGETSQFVDLGDNLCLQLTWSSLEKDSNNHSPPTIFNNIDNLQQNATLERRRGDDSFDILVPGIESSSSSTAAPPRRLRITLQQRPPPPPSCHDTLSTSTSSSSPQPTPVLKKGHMNGRPENLLVSNNKKNDRFHPVRSSLESLLIYGGDEEDALADHHHSHDDNDIDNNNIDNNNIDNNIDDGRNNPYNNNDNNEGDIFVESNSSSLHQLFYSPRDVTLDDVLDILDRDPTAAFTTEPSTSKLPLHVLSEQHRLLQTTKGRDETTRIVKALIQVHPASMTTTDAQGNMPFVANIKSWVTSLYEDDSNKQLHHQSTFTTSSLIDMVASLTPIAKLRASTGTWSSPDPNSYGSLHRKSSNDSDPNNSSCNSPNHNVNNIQDSTTTSSSPTSSGSNHHHRLGNLQSVNHRNNSNSNSNSISISTRYCNTSSALSKTFSVVAPPPDNGASMSKMASRIFPVTSLTDQVIWSFEMLSLGLDEMVDTQQQQHHTSSAPSSYKTQQQQQQQPTSSRNSLYQAPLPPPNSSRSVVGKSRNVIRETRMALATNVLQQVPFLIKSLLLLEDSTLRERLWSLSISRQMLVNDAVIGLWLTPMLRRHGLPSQQAIDFFVLVSETKVEDLIGTVLHPSEEDKQVFESEQRRVFEAVEALGETIPSLALLNDPKEIERAATTSVVWFVMNKELSSPFTVGLILIDLVLHVTLLLSFRSQANLPRKGTGSLLSNVPVGIVLTICAHYLIRKITEGLALLNISTVLMRRYFWNLWRILDLATIIITIGAISWASRHPGQYRPIWNAIVLFLLWMKVLAFLKVVNRETATFILSLFEIIKDIRNFLIVLLVIILMFADMLHLLITTEEGHFCNQPADQLDGSQLAFCSPALVDGYLRAYVILLNDFDLQSYRESGATTFVFILYTVLGSIIMLNVLIAVINESYQKSRISSALLFGRARVGFVAEHTALEQFLQPGGNPFEQLASSTDERLHPCGKYWHKMAVAGRWLVLLSLLGTAASSLVYLVGKAVEAPSVERSIFVTVVFATLSILLAMAMLVVAHSCFAGLVTGLAPRAVAQRVVAVCDFPVQHITRFVSVYLFGLTGAPPPVGFFKTFRLIHRGGRHDSSDDS